MIIQPYAHQIRAAEYIHKHRYVILNMEMGTGKTLAASLASSQIKGAKVLIVCPSYLKDSWKSELWKYFEFPEIEVFYKKADIQKPRNETEFCIVSYSMLGPETDCLFEWSNFVISDESHYVKAMEAKRTLEFHRSVYEFCPKYLALLTGTPIENRVYEIYSLILLTSYKFSQSAFLQRFPTEVEFADTFSHRREFIVDRRKVIQWYGLKNKELLKTFLVDRYLKITTKECLDLPEIVYKEVQVEYKDDPKLELEFKNASDTGSVKSEYKVQSAIAKAPFTIKYVENLLEEVGRCVIYSDHVAPVEEIAAHFNTEAITGSMDTSLRMKIAQEFQEGKRNLIVATIGSFSTGVNLQIANNMVFNDLSWVPGRNDQAVHRINRIGTKETSIIHLILGSFQDLAISKSLREKQKVIGEI